MRMFAYMIDLVIYNLFIKLLQGFMHVASVLSPKARLWLQGRRHWQAQLKEALQKAPSQGQEIVWMHASSTGEFEQGRPIIEQLKKDKPDLFVLITFFSPSGYYAARQYPHAQFIMYLPLDTKANARTFVQLLKPTLVLWIKYEYWYHYLHTLHQAQIPVLLVAANFLPRQPFTKWYGSLHRQMLTFFKALFVQDQASKKILDSLELSREVWVAGDSRFDRVQAIADQWLAVSDVEPFLEPNKIKVVAGSTWPPDHRLIRNIIEKGFDFQWIIAPHLVDEKTLKNTLKELPGATLLSSLQNAPTSVLPSVIIADKMGVLSRLYKYAHICYVGGGFKTGLHNTLEAAVYGKPVFWGPHYSDFKEAIALVEAGGGFSVSDAQQWSQHLMQLTGDTYAYEATCQKAAQYVQSMGGSTNKILEYIYKNRLLTR